jgi:hypothetical protein
MSHEISFPLRRMLLKSRREKPFVFKFGEKDGGNGRKADKNSSSVSNRSEGSSMYELKSLGDEDD